MEFLTEVKELTRCHRCGAEIAAGDAQPDPTLPVIFHVCAACYVRQLAYHDFFQQGGRVKRTGGAWGVLLVLLGLFMVGLGVCGVFAYAVFIVWMFQSQLHEVIGAVLILLVFVWMVGDIFSGVQDGIRRWKERK